MFFYVPIMCTKLFVIISLSQNNLKWIQIFETVIKKNNWKQLNFDMKNRCKGFEINALN